MIGAGLALGVIALVAGYVLAPADFLARPTNGSPPVQGAPGEVPGTSEDPSTAASTGLFAAPGVSAPSGLPTRKIPSPPTGWPSSADTGYRRAPGYPGKLTPFSGQIESNRTYRFLEFPPGFVIRNVTNVTFFGCKFGGSGSADWNVTVSGGNNITFDYSSFEPKSLAAPPVGYTQSSQYGLRQDPTVKPGNVTVNHSDFWGFGNAVAYISSGDPSRVFRIRNSYIHDARADGGKDHTDGILNNLNSPSTGSHLVVDHNTIISRGNTNGLALQDERVHDVVVTNNYFSGFGYTVHIGHGTNTNVTFTNNTFGTDIKPDWGPLYAWPKGSNNLWRGNRWRVVPGSYYKNLEDDGKYWWPDGSLKTVDYAGP